MVWETLEIIEDRGAEEIVGALASQSELLQHYNTYKWNPIARCLLSEHFPKFILAFRLVLVDIVIYPHASLRPKKLIKDKR